jgi:hypothetical protein
MNFQGGPDNSAPVGLAVLDVKRGALVFWGKKEEEISF